MNSSSLKELSGENSDPKIDKLSLTGKCYIIVQIHHGRIGAQGKRFLNSLKALERNRPLIWRLEMGSRMLGKEGEETTFSVGTNKRPCFSNCEWLADVCLAMC